MSISIPIFKLRCAEEESEKEVKARITTTKRNTSFLQRSGKLSTVKLEANEVEGTALKIDRAKSNAGSAVIYSLVLWPTMRWKRRNIFPFYWLIRKAERKTTALLHCTRYG